MTQNSPFRPNIEENRMTGHNRIVRVATVSQAELTRSGNDELVDRTLERADQAAAYGPDILCLPEGFAGREPESVPGPTSEKASAWARAHHCYLICSMKVLSDGVPYNSAVIIDRQGRIQGRYDKTHPTDSEIAAGVECGSLDVPVFETDFGTIGVQICYDVNWPEDWKRLKEKGAEVVFFAAAYPAHLQLTTLAQVNQYYVVSSARSRTSRVYDITGRVMARSGYLSLIHI